MRIQRKTLETGYDMGKPRHVEKLTNEIQSGHPPDRVWISRLCAAVTSIQRLNQRAEKQVNDPRKKRQKCRRHLKAAITLIWALMLVTSGASLFYFEWPKWASDGWNFKEMQQFIYEFQKYYDKLDFVQIDGCMHGVKSPDGWFAQKSWIVMTNDWEFQKRCQLTCDRSHEHRPGGMVGMGSKAVSDTAFYPESMVRAIAKLWKDQWFKAMKMDDQKIFQALNTLEKSYAADEEDEAPTDETIDDEEPIPKEAELERRKAWSLLH